MAASGTNNTLQWTLADGVLTLSPVSGQTLGLALCETCTAENSKLTDFITLTDDERKSVTTVKTSGKVAFGNAAGDRFAARFYNTNSLSALFPNVARADLNGFDTSQVSDMACMFMECSNLKTLDVSSFDTSKVRSMNGMFRYCSSLTALNVSNFDISNVYSMSLMFQDCSSLTTLDLSSFGSSKAWDVTFMFTGCSSLTALNVSNLDLSNANDLYGMFQDCSSLTTLDLPKSNVSNVTIVDATFTGCFSLTALDLSGFDFSNVSDTYSLHETLEECRAIITLPPSLGDDFDFSLNMTATGERDGSNVVCVVSVAPVGHFRVAGNKAVITLSCGGSAEIDLDTTGATTSATITHSAATSAMTVTATATDFYGNTVTTSFELPDGFYLLDFDTGGKSIGIGQEADAYADLTDNEKETGRLDISMDTNLHAPVTMDSTLSVGGAISAPYLVGAIQMYGGATAPAGWLLCDGSAVSRTTYSKLFEVLGTAYGEGDGSTTFNVPNFSGRFPIGSATTTPQTNTASCGFNGGNQPYDYADTDGLGWFDLGEYGGEVKHTLTTAEMPSHTHSQNSHSHSWSGYRVLYYNYSETGNVGVGERGLASSSGNYKVPSVNSSKTNWVGADTSGDGTATNNKTGGGGAHNQMPPFLSVNYIIYSG